MVKKTETKRKAKEKVDPNPPIKLSGGVYTDKILAELDATLAISGRKLVAGDIKLICLVHQPTDKKTQPNLADGFFVAYIYDGKRWRKFSLRDEAAKKATYKSYTERLSRMRDIVRLLKQLKGSNAEWAHKSYAVLERTVEEKPAAPLKPKKQGVLFQK